MFFTATFSCPEGQANINGACADCLDNQIIVDGQCESCPNGQIVVNGVCQGMECFVPLISMSYLWLWNTCEMRRFSVMLSIFGWKM